MRRYCKHKYYSHYSHVEITVEAEIIGNVFNSDTKEAEFILLVYPNTGGTPYYKSASINKCYPIKKLTKKEKKK